MTNKQKRIYTLIAFAIAAAILICVNNMTSPTYILRSVLQMGAIYALAAVSMNLLNGFTGLFSLGQAGFMAIGAYTFAIFTIPIASRPNVYYLYGMADAIADVQLPIILALILAGVVSALLAFLFGIPVLRLKSDYFAIATLGLAEIIRIVVGSSLMNNITNGSLGLKSIPSFPSIFGVIPGFYFPFIVATICIAIIVLLLRSSYGRAFKAIREDEIAAEAMGINLAHHKRLSFIISSFFAGISGALMAMFLGAVTSTTFNIAMTYYILLIVVIGGMGSVTGSVISAFIVIASKEWLLRFLDTEMYIGAFQVPLLKSGFRMVVFSVILMIVVLFFRRGLMGNREFSWEGFFGLFRRRKKKENSQGGEQIG